MCFSLDEPMPLSLELVSVKSNLGEDLGGRLAFQF
jgi:hypothetical protein